MLMECYLRYGDSFVASTSDFWWDRVRKASFGACIGNFMAHQYRMKSGIDLFMSDATLNSLSSDDDPRGWERHLRSKASSLGRCQTLLDFVLFDKPHTGEEVGAWLDHAHGRVQCKPSFIGSHVVDKAGYAGESVEKLK